MRIDDTPVNRGYAAVRQGTMFGRARRLAVSGGDAFAAFGAAQAFSADRPPYSSIGDQMKVKIGDLLARRAVARQPVVLDVFLLDQFANHREASEHERHVFSRQRRDVLDVSLRKKHQMNARLGPRVTNGDAGVRLEHDARNHPGVPLNRRRGQQARNLIGAQATTAAIANCKKGSWQGTREQISAGNDAGRQQKERKQ
jgi:hypothetical protein